MNQLTALFVQQLSEHVSQSDELLQRVRRELVRTLEERLSLELHPGTLYCSGAGLRIKEQAAAWKGRAQQITKPSEAIGCLSELERLCKAASGLHGETMKTLRAPGSVDGQRLHYFYPDEQREALKVINEVIQINLYRILALGGTAHFRRVPPLASVSSRLADRLRYYKESVSPAVASLDGQQKYGYWTVQHKEGCHAGPMGILPLYFVCGLQKRGRYLMPGEYRTEKTVGGTVCQGSGYLTNVTPQTILQAQEESICDRLTEKDLSEWEMSEDPIGALNEYFSGKWYAIDPYELFAMASMEETAGTLLRRGRLNQCCYCGSPMENRVPLCGKCMERIRIR